MLETVIGALVIGAIIGLAIQLKRIERQNLHIIRLLTGDDDHS